MKIIGVIPARYGSSRYPGKPLIDICGKPMIWWVYQQAKMVTGLDDIYVATEDQRIVDECEKYNLNVMLTSDKHETGTDRCSEVAANTDGDYYVIIFGDEPLIQAENIQQLIDKMISTPNADAGMLATTFHNPVDVINNTTVKLALNDDGDLIFMSRSAIPYPKKKLDYEFHKHVGVYIFTRSALLSYNATPRGRLELIEDNELIRLLEHHKIIKTVLIETDAMSVDTEKDREKIERMLRNRLYQIGY